MPAPLDVDALSGLVQTPSDEAAEATRRRLEELAKPVGSLGRLEDLAVWISAVQDTSPPRDFRRARVVLFAADHGIAAAGVSAYAPSATAARVHLLTSGNAATNALARATGATVRVVDVGVTSEPPQHDAPRSQPEQAEAPQPDPPQSEADPLAEAPREPASSTWRVRAGSGRVDREDALTLAEAESAFAAGVSVAEEEVDGGADLRVAADLGVGATTVAAVLVAALTDTEPVRVIGRGSGIDDDAWMRKVTAIRDALRRARPFVADPLALLAVSGGADLAALAGFLVQAAVRRTPVVLDGVVPTAAALLAAHVAPIAPQWWLAGSLSPEPAHRIALERLELTPVLDLGLRLGEGTGALAALPLLRAAVLTCAETATLADAGIARA